MSENSGIPKVNISPLVNARALYCFYYMALGAFMPFINLYYERLGLSGVQIGTLAALPVFLAVTVTFLWGAAADAFRMHRAILRTVLFLAPLAVFMLSQASHFTALIPFVLAYALITSPIVPLLDSNALEVAKEHQRSYGEMRVWGSIGWAVSTWLVGLLIEALNIHWLFYCYILLITVTFLLSLFQPARKLTLQLSMGHGLRELFRHDFIVFLVSVFLLTTASGGVNSFFSLYMDQIGAGEGVIGFSWALAALSELPVMIFSAPILRRIGAKGLLTTAFFIFILRWLMYSVIGAPVWALLVQLLHGLSFAAFLVGAVTFVSEHTPEGLSTTAQAIFNTVAFGLASITGSMIGGYLYDTVGMTSMFRVFSLLGLVGVAVFLLAGKRKVIFVGG
ncbi:MAG: MFS transporter [Kiritimatiellota bacterium]|nr:MFS transporter [Kiritimatiellota bacterium]